MLKTFWKEFVESFQKRWCFAVAVIGLSLVRYVWNHNLSTTPENLWPLVRVEIEGGRGGERPALLERSASPPLRHTNSTELYFCISQLYFCLWERPALERRNPLLSGSPTPLNWGGGGRLRVGMKGSQRGEDNANLLKYKNEDIANFLKSKKEKRGLY